MQGMSVKYMSSICGTYEACGVWCEIVVDMLCVVDIWHGGSTCGCGGYIGEFVPYVHLCCMCDVWCVMSVCNMNCVYVCGMCVLC